MSQRSGAPLLLPTHRAAGSVLIVGRSGALDMDVRPAEATGRDATFQIAFLNQAPAPVVMSLAARDSEDALCVHIEPPSPVVVPPGATAALATVHVRPKGRGTRGRPQRYAIEVRGRRVKSEQLSTPDLVAHARFTYRPRPTLLRALQERRGKVPVEADLAADRSRSTRWMPQRVQSNSARTDLAAVPEVAVDQQAPPFSKLRLARQGFVAVPLPQTDAVNSRAVAARARVGHDWRRVLWAVLHRRNGLLVRGAALAAIVVALGWFALAPLGGWAGFATLLIGVALLVRPGCAPRETTIMLLTATVGVSAVDYFAWRWGVINWASWWVALPLFIAEFFGALAHAIDGGLRHGKRYKLIAMLPSSTVYGPGYYWIWRKT